MDEQVILEAPFGHELDWQLDALCSFLDPGTWFPEQGVSAQPAKELCSRCAVRKECLEYAIANEIEFGVWGGMDQRERRPLRSAARGIHVLVASPEGVLSR